MELTTTNLMLSVFFSSVGLGFFMFGKKQQRFVFLVDGLCLMVYSYFMPSAWIMTIVGVLLMVIPYLIRA